MVARLIVALPCALMAASSFGQAAVMWHRTDLFQGVDSLRYAKVLPHPSGSFIVIGWYQGFGGSPSATRGLVRMISPDGAYIWSRSITGLAGAANVKVQDAKVLADGGVYCCGSGESSFVVRFDSTGGIVRSKFARIPSAGAAMGPDYSTYFASDFTTPVSSAIRRRHLDITRWNGLLQETSFPNSWEEPTGGATQAGLVEFRFWDSDVFCRTISLNERNNTTVLLPNAGRQGWLVHTSLNDELTNDAGYAPGLAVDDQGRLFIARFDGDQEISSEKRLRSTGELLELFRGSGGVESYFSAFGRSYRSSIHYENPHALTRLLVRTAPSYYAELALTYHVGDIITTAIEIQGSSYVLRRINETNGATQFSFLPGPSSTFSIASTAIQPSTGDLLAIGESGANTSLAKISQTPWLAAETNIVPKNSVAHPCPSVLNNDRFVKGVLVGIENQPAVGSMHMTPDGAFTYTPPADWTGTTSYRYRVLRPGLPFIRCQSFIKVQ